MEYKTQMEAAKKGIVTKELAAVAKKEGFTEAELLPLVASGRVIIPANVRHKSLDPNGVGEGLRTKINVNLGISGDCADYAEGAAGCPVWRRGHHGSEQLREDARVP